MLLAYVSQMGSAVKHGLCAIESPAFLARKGRADNRNERLDGIVLIKPLLATLLPRRARDASFKIYGGLVGRSELQMSSA